VAVKPQLLALRALGLGDFLAGVPAYRALAAAFPDHERLLAAPPGLAPLVALEGSFAGLVPVRPLQPLPTWLPAPDVAVNLHGCGPQSHRLLLELRPRRLVAFACAGLADGPAWQAEEHERERWCRMLVEHGIAADPDDLELPASPLGDPPACPYLLAHPGAASPSRRWPVGSWVRLLEAEAEAGRRAIVSGGPDEVAIAQRIAAGIASPHVEVRAGSLSLLELAELVAGAELLVCGDTGVAHLATALRTPSVLLFGPTSPAHWGPPAARTWHRVLWKGTRGDPHGDHIDPGLARISVEEVREAVAELRAELAAQHGRRPAHFGLTLRRDAAPEIAVGGRG
jgi:ADP-heptose:LPS heptosyltransferase